jgi:hypothetical protein
MSPSGRLILSVGLIVLVWRLPYGQQALYPLSLLATFAHEMGHGLTALVVGAEFKSLSMYADGSGLAAWRGSSGRLATALIAAGGLLGPTVAGVTLLILSRWQRYVRIALAVLAVLVLTSAVLWVRNPFGVAFVLAVALCLGGAARYLSDGGAAFFLNLLALTLCLSLFRDIDYMFSDVAVVEQVSRHSDSAAIAAALWLPYWLWGGLIVGFSLALLALGIWAASRCAADEPNPEMALNSAMHDVLEGRKKQ